MSLVALALRIATCQALLGKTLAGESVFDSEIGAISETALKQQAPFIAVYTDSDSGMVTGRDLREIDREDVRDGLNLVFQTAVAAAVTVPAENGGTQTELTIPQTDRGLELVINLLGHQITRVLMSDPGDWAEMWRRLALRINRIESRRGADDSKGVRFAASERVLACDPVAEPTFGAPPEGIWADLLALMRADTSGELSGVADLIEAEITSPSGLADWNQIAALYGLTRAGVQGMGIAPLFNTTTEPAPAATEAQIEGGDGSVLTVDQDPQGASLTDRGGTTTPLQED